MQQGEQLPRQITTVESTVTKSKIPRYINLEVIWINLMSIDLITGNELCKNDYCLDDGREGGVLCMAIIEYTWTYINNNNNRIKKDLSKAD